MTLERIETILRVGVCLLLLSSLPGCAGRRELSNAEDSAMNISKEKFGVVRGQEVSLYTLRNDNGIEARITDFGAIVVSLSVPDRKGRIRNVVLGYDTLKEYIADDSYFGCVAGRYANRIANGRFSLGGATYQLATNNRPNHLHGGVEGFNKKVWRSEAFEEKGGVGIKLDYLSPDREEGYPGNLNVSVTYLLTMKGALEVFYEASTDKPTVVNLTHHGYFNLAGAGHGNILAHDVMIAADRYTPVDENLIPTGELADVKRTPLDFREAKPIGRDIESEYSQIVRGAGFDHNFVLSERRSLSPKFAARVSEPLSGRVMEVFTTEPGLQFYTGNFLPVEGKRGRDGERYHYRDGFCLEAQVFPDSPNQAEFPSSMLVPGKNYTQRTIYQFPTAR